jgi:hypothetical protein
VLVRVREGRLVIDPRTLLDGDDDVVVTRMADALARTAATLDETSGGTSS